ncbi:MAG: MXAN_5187 C-terminal domain-containing protein [Myxococcota bacterium]|nr:MXAN_5187 C-terminal domain-containing protein [Myxococcota bacterium]
MARRNQIDRTVNAQLDELEQSMFVLKVQYEKYFSGIERLEPIRYRDEVLRLIRTLLQNPIQNTRQAYRFRQLRARWNTLDLYLRRNLVMIERGTHPKFRFRADLKDQSRKSAEAKQDAARQELAARAAKARREDAAFRKIYDHYMTARAKCGQSTDMEYESVQKALRQQVRNIKARYKCNSVSFRVQVEDGKAKLKAVPKR